MVKQIEKQIEKIVAINVGQVVGNLGWLRKVK